MRIPPDLLSNTQAALAALSVLLSMGGLLFTALLGVGLFSALQSADAAISPALGSLASAAANLEEMAEASSQSAESATGAISALSDALQFYANSSSSISESLYSVSAVPPFSLDPRFALAASDLKASSGQFRNSSIQLNATALSASQAASALRSAALDISAAAGSLEGAGSLFRSAMNSLYIAAIALMFALLALFSSVLLLSVSILLSHYPRLFEKAKEDAGDAAKDAKNQKK